MRKTKETQIIIGNEALLVQGNYAIIPELFHIDYSVHAGTNKYKGHAFIKRFTKKLRMAIPDIRVKHIKILSQTKDTLVWQRTLVGTHKVDMWRIPATNKQVEWCDMVVSRFQGKLIAEETMVSELAGALLSKIR